MKTEFSHFVNEKISEYPEDRYDYALIYNNLVYQNWFHDIYNKDRKKFVQISIDLMGDNVKLFTEKYGTPLYYFKSEYKWYIWEVEYKKEVYELWTSKGGGTQILIQQTMNDIHDNKVMGYQIIDFITYLLKELYNITL